MRTLLAATLLLALAGCSGGSEPPREQPTSSASPLGSESSCSLGGGTFAIYDATDQVEFEFVGVDVPGDAAKVTYAAAIGGTEFATDVADGDATARIAEPGTDSTLDLGPGVVEVEGDRITTRFDFDDYAVTEGDESVVRVTADGVEVATCVAEL